MLLMTPSMSLMTPSYVTQDSLILWHIYMWRDLLKCDSWLIHTWLKTPSYVMHDSLSSWLATCLPWHVTRNSLEYDAFKFNSWFVQMCDMTHSYWFHELIHMCDLTYSYVWQDSIMCVTRPIHMCDMTRSLFTRATTLIHTCDETRSPWRSEDLRYRSYHIST